MKLRALLICLLSLILALSVPVRAEDVQEGAFAAALAQARRDTESAGKLLADAQARDILWRQDFIHRAYEWQLVASIVVFAMVMLVIAVGLFLTVMQFTRDERRQRRRARPAAGASDDSEGAAKSSLKLSTTGVEISSQVLGILILVLSLGFFYLYVVDIYPLMDATRKAPRESAQQAPAAGTALPSSAGS